MVRSFMASIVEARFYRSRLLSSPRALMLADASAENPVVRYVSVRIDEQLVDLRRQSLDHMLHHRPAAKGLQALVDATHAAALPARQYDARDFDHASRSFIASPADRLRCRKD